MRLSSTILSLFLVLWAGAVAAQNGGGTASFQLRPGDAIRLAVKDEPDLSADYPVLSDGTVLLPLVGVVRVAGTDFGVVEQQVRAAFAREMTDPVLVLMPVVRVAVLGEVRVPGLYLLDGTFDVTEALARAGGLTPSGSMERIALLRDGRSERLRQEANLPVPMVRVLPGDQLIVGRRSWFAENSTVLVGAGTSVLVAALTALLVR